MFSTGCESRDSTEGGRELSDVAMVAFAYGSARLKLSDLETALEKGATEDVDFHNIFNHPALKKTIEKDTELSIYELDLLYDMPAVKYAILPIKYRLIKMHDHAKYKFCHHINFFKHRVCGVPKNALGVMQEETLAERLHPLMATIEETSGSVEVVRAFMSIWKCYLAYEVGEYHLHCMAERTPVKAESYLVFVLVVNHQALMNAVSKKVGASVPEVKEKILAALSEGAGVAEAVARVDPAYAVDPREMEESREEVSRFFNGKADMEKWSGEDPFKEEDPASPSSSMEGDDQKGQSGWGGMMALTAPV